MSKRVSTLAMSMTSKIWASLLDAGAERNGLAEKW